MNCVAIDFETANEARSSACALAIAVIQRARIISVRSWLIRPPVLRFNKINTGIHGITADHVRDRPEFDHIWKEVGPQLTESTIIAHNASFDLSVFRSLCDYYDIDYPELKYYCTCRLARRVWPALENHRLSTVARYLGIALRHHDVSQDAEACAHIALRCCEHANVPDLETLGAQFGYEPGHLLRAVSPPAGTIHRKEAPSRTLPVVHASRLASARQVETVSGRVRYEIEVRHDDLGKYQLIRCDNLYVAEQKAASKIAQWDEQWRNRVAVEERRRRTEQQSAAVAEGKVIAAERTTEAHAELDGLRNTLAHTLKVNDAIDWEKLKDFNDFPKRKPAKPEPPVKPSMPSLPDEPRPSDRQYQPEFTLLDKALASRRAAKIDLMAARFKADHAAWQEQKRKLIDETNRRIREYNETVRAQHAAYKQAVAKWERARQKYLEERDARNAAIDENRERYHAKDSGAILDYCDMVLTNSQYPEYFPQSYELDYREGNNLLVVDYELPAPRAIPRVCEIRFLQSRSEFVEKQISESQLNKLYDDLLYQITLRTIHELFEADVVDAIATIVFNGYVRSIDPGTGRESYGCVLSVQAMKEEFAAINLALVEPKACFKKLKGVGSSKLHSVTPVAPILTIEREDRRFVESYSVAEHLEEGQNLATMDWEDFEHLVREVFEQHFADGGGEVKVTRASRDGGIDAVVFDPDPIRGGKIVIQAKRYTGTVGVSAVRDLYGTLVNEGANKGILVTTSDYGPDAYEFARGKPLTLLNGSNLLHLLESHGHSVKIDVKEAKRIDTRL